MLYGPAPGIQGRFEQRPRRAHPKALELFNMVEELKDFAKGFMQVIDGLAVFEAERDGNAFGFLRRRPPSRCRLFIRPVASAKTDFA